MHRSQATNRGLEEARSLKHGAHRYLRGKLLPIATGVGREIYWSSSSTRSSLATDIRGRAGMFSCADLR